MGMQRVTRSDDGNSPLSQPLTIYSQTDPVGIRPFVRLNTRNHKRNISLSDIDAIPNLSI